MNPTGRNGWRSRPGLASALSASTLLFASVLAYPSSALAATPVVSLGSAGSYSVLAGTGVASTGDTKLSGDLGVSPSNSITGFPPGIVEGATHAGDTQAAQAQLDMLAAYTDADDRTPTSEFSGDQNGQTFISGVHHTGAAFALTGTMTLDGQNDPNAVFIFQVDAALNTAADSHITLINGAKASRVFWQVLGAAGTGANSTFTGTIMAQGAVTIGEAAGLDGRAMSRGTITLANNTLTTSQMVRITGGASGLTNDTTPTITGISDLAAGTTVTVTIDGQTLVTTVQPGGGWNVTAAAVAPGQHDVVATVTDPAGQTGSATQSLTVDTTLPAVTITGGATRSTNVATPTIAGTTDAATGMVVTVTVAAQSVTTTVHANGTWSVTASALTEGPHNVVASVTDPAGNTGTASQSLTVDTATPVVSLGSAGSYSVLAGTGVASTGDTKLSGDLGVSPSNSITGFPPGIVEGATHAGDTQAAQAQLDMAAAYTNAAARIPTTLFAGDQTGHTFTSGVHHTTAAFALTGTMTLDGQNDPNAVFIFQVDAALNTAADSHITLINGAKASRVFWQVVGAAGTGANSTFTGTIMAQGAVTIGALGGLDGRAMSRGTITLAGNTVTPGSGVLSISVPTNAGNLGTTANTVSGASITGLLGQVEVNDGRDAAAGSGWNASVVSTAFSASNGQLIAASSVDYTAGTLTGVGTVTLTAGDPNNLTSAATAVTATGIAGNNSATWNPSIHVFIPGSTVAGIYSAVITHSVL